MAVKWILFVRRKPGLTLEQFREHYETVHVPLAMKLLPGIQRYVRNYFAPTPEVPEPEYDVATEFWFDSEADEQATRAFYAADPDQTLQRDEETFMDRSSMQLHTVIEHETRRE